MATLYCASASPDRAPASVRVKGGTAPVIIGAVDAAIVRSRRISLHSILCPSCQCARWQSGVQYTGPRHAPHMPAAVRRDTRVPQFAKLPQRSVAPVGGERNNACEPAPGVDMWAAPPRMAAGLSGRGDVRARTGAERRRRKRQDVCRAFVQPIRWHGNNSCLECCAPLISSSLLCVRTAGPPSLPPRLRRVAHGCGTRPPAARARHSLVAGETHAVRYVRRQAQGPQCDRPRRPREQGRDRRRQGR